MNRNLYFNLRKNEVSEDISVLFPEWKDGEESVVVFGPHDDDPLIGAGHIMTAAMERGAAVYLILFCQGDCGYSHPEEKDAIVAIRMEETYDVYGLLGIPRERIIRMEIPDFSALSFKGHYLADGSKGTFEPIIRFLREHRITRVLTPNGYREHADHTAVYEMAAYDVIQANDPIVADWGQVGCVKSVLQYSVWADFSPEDMLVEGDTLRANRAMLATPEAEQRLGEALAMYRSQGKIIANLIRQREERVAAGGYLELYIALDTRPKLEFAPYIERVNAILNQQ